MKLSPFLAAIGVAALAAYGCGSPVKSEKSLTPPFTIPSGTWVDPVNPDEDEEPSEAAGFFVKVKSDTAEVTVHRSDTAYGGDPGTMNFSTSCRIPVGTSLASDKDILCIAEIEELDAFFSELTIQYHLPPSMCSYAKFMPYYFYAREAGVGITAMTLTLNDDGTVQSTTPGLDAITGAPECDYDYSHSGQDGPNCCVGDYVLTTITDIPAPDPDEVVISRGEWGGKAANCMSGPGMSESYNAYRDVDNLPLLKTNYVVGEGLNATFTIPAPIGSTYNSKALKSTLWTANYYQVSDHAAHSPAVLPADRPLALRNPANLTGIYAHQPSDVYRFECHNRAEEIQYRIRLMIREWNTDPISQGGNPELNVGTDPDFPDGPINDRVDWFDVGDAYPENSI